MPESEKTKADVIFSIEVRFGSERTIGLAVGWREKNCASLRIFCRLKRQQA